MPPLCVAEFLMAAQMDDHGGSSEYLFEWHVVFIPWLLALSLWVLSETPCLKCCHLSETFHQLESEAGSPGPGTDLDMELGTDFVEPALQNDVEEQKADGYPPVSQDCKNTI